MIYSIETFRIIAVFLVVYIHTGSFIEVSDLNSGHIYFFIANNIARFAVPFFFIATGFFTGKSLMKS